MQPEKHSQVQALAAQAAAARKENRLQDALRDMTQVVSICREEGDEALLARALPGLGQIERDLEDTGNALAHYSEAAELHRAQGNSRRLAHTVRHIADIHLDAGELEQAGPLYEEALEIYTNDPAAQPLDFANCIRGFAIFNEKSGSKEKALLLWKEAQGLYEAVGVEAGVQESAQRAAALAEGL